MAQYPLQSTAGQTGLTVRTQINQAIQSAVTNFAGGSDPATMTPSNAYAYMVWVDTTNKLIKQRNSANTAWLTIGEVQTDGALNFYDDTKAPAGFGLGSICTDVTDANAAVLCGFYKIPGTTNGGLNIPTTNTTAYLFVENAGVNDVKQTCFLRSSGSMYIRHKLSGTWSAWAQLATTSTPTFDGAVKVNGDTNNDCIYLYSNAGVKETIIGSSDALPFYVYDVKNTKFAFRWTGTAFGVNAPIAPYVDNAYTLGGSAARWSVVYAATSTISTSDANLKQQITDLSEVEKQVATKLKTLIKKFKFNDSVAEKGDKARWHIGVIAQEVREAFEEHGLDVSEYGLFCSDTWYEKDGETVDADTEGAEEKTRLSIRYEELLAFIISAL